MNTVSIAKRFIKQLLPPAATLLAKAALTRLRTHRIKRQYGGLGLKETFDRIYAVRAWAGGSNEQLCSGPGSTGRYVREYCALLKGLLITHDLHSLADLGCGNFNTGKAIVRITDRYTGVDISQLVVEANTRLYGNNRVRFVRADLTTDRLPAADVGIVRQVLQHLSNAEVQMVLENVRHTYPIAFITEHVYVGRGCKPNLDITHGPGTRVPWRSGVFIDQPPFNLPAALVADVQYAADEVLRTWVVEGTFNESRSSRHPIA